MTQLKFIPAAMTALGLVLLASCSGTKNNTDIALDLISSDILTVDGKTIGQVNLLGLGEGGVQVNVMVSDISPGTHAMHFHEIGKCEAPDFKSSGGHYNPDQKAHGMKMADGPHAGDMMNVVAGTDGKGVFNVINDRVSISGDHGLHALLDADGTALVLHAGADDYESQPSGAAGARIGCAVIGE